MESSDIAYNAAKAEIYKAKETGKESLVLYGAIFRDLKEIPSEISELREIKQIAIDKSQITDDDLRKIGQLNQLATLQLQSRNITDVGISHLNGLKTLHSLELYGSGISDDAFLTILKLNNLTRLSVTRSAIQGLHFDRIAELPKLYSVDFGSTKVSDDTISHLKNLPLLRGIDLRNTNITDRGIADTLASRKLSLIQLQGTRITDDTLKLLGGHDELHIIGIEDTNVTDYGVSHLTSLQSLFTFWLSNTHITDDGLASVSHLNRLQSLTLGGTHITDEGLVNLKNLKELKNLDLKRTEIRDTGLGSLSDLESLQALNLSGTKLTENGLYRLSGLNKLDVLHIDQTQVSDLRPLLEFPILDKGIIWFGNTPAVNLDPRLAELSTITDDSLRTKETYSYLRSLDNSWPPIPVSPQQEDILRVELAEDGRFDVKPSLPNEGELSDTVKKKSHELLLLKARELAQTGGNRYPWIAKTASALFNLLDRPLKDVDILAVYLELESLRGSYNRRNEGDEEERLTQQLVSGIETVLIIGPGLVLDHDDVEKLEERRNRNPFSPDAVKQQQTISQAIESSPELFGDKIRAYSATLGSDIASTSTAARHAHWALNRNTLIGVGTLVAQSLIAGPLGDIGSHAVAWFVRHSGEIALAMPEWGEAVRVWLTPILMRAKEVHLGVKHFLRR